MLFNSWEYLLFLPIVFLLHWCVFSRRLISQNLFLIVASYLFYGWWDWRFLVLISFTSLCSYASGLYIARYRNKRHALARTINVLNIVINLGILGLFKYYNFFAESFANTFLSGQGGGSWLAEHGLLLNLILPVGISFYTFQALSYSIDVYRGKLDATHDPVAFFAFISFFPQLVAGPIERATNLLPQFTRRKVFDYDDAIKGSKLILWGFFMKLCVADRIAEYVNAVYNNVPEHNGSSILIATFLFAFQIYCDFGGYSLIAIGTAKMMGFSLMENFRRPYFSSSLKEFWKRWHISLSTWFMDYVYIPLGGNRVPYGRHLFNLFLTFLVSGIWHGANWTFILWGATHGMLLIIENIYHRLFGNHLLAAKRLKPLNICFCFLLVCFAWIFFRANTVADAFECIRKIVISPGMPYIHPMIFLFGGLSIAILLIKEAIDEWHPVSIKNGVGGFLFYLLLTLYILMFGALSGSNQFIYFQF